MEKRLVVFDLDFTIWDCGGTWCDHTYPPYKRVNGHITDKHGRCIRLYADVMDILQYLQSKDITMALASRTSAPDWAGILLGMFEIQQFFPLQEIYPGSKISHFSALREKTGISFSEMLFLDDEYRNIQEVSSLGVECVYVDEGVTMEVIQKYV